jgi:hypothetical protein
VLKSAGCDTYPAAQQQRDIAAGAQEVRPAG